MKNSKEKIKNKNKSPTLFGIKILILFCFFMFISFSFIRYIFNSFTSKNEIISISIMVILAGIISISLLNLIFKNFKIYRIKNFFKTLKISSLYLTYLFFILIYKIYSAIIKNNSFKSISEIIFFIFATIIVSGFVTDSIFNGLILNSFAKKYVDKPYGIFKILIYPNLLITIQ